MSQSNKFLLPIIGAVVLAGAAAGAYFLLSRSGSQPEVTIGTDQPQVPTPAINEATIVPSNALILVAVNTDGAALKQLETFLPADAKKILDEAVNTFNRGLKDANIDLAKDIQPWAGNNLVVAILPAGKPAASRPLYSPVSFKDGTNWRTVQAQVDAPTPPNFVIVVGVKDQSAANKFLETARAKAGGKTKNSDYKGVTITVPEAGGDKAPISAFVKDYLVLSNREASIQAVIDTANGGESISGALPTTGLAVENSLVSVFIPNVKQNAEALTTLVPDTNGLPPNAVKQLKLIESIALVMGVDSKGIRLKSVTKYDSAIPLPTGVAPNKILTLLPGETLAVVTGLSIKAEWERILKLAEQFPEIKQAVEIMRSSAKAQPWALEDLDKDVFGWMDGEYSIAIIPSSEGILANTGMGPVLMLQTSDRASAEKFLKKLDEISQKTGAQVATKDVGGVTVTEHTIPGAGTFLAHGWVQSDTLFFGSAPLVSLIVPKPNAPLTEDASFKALLGSLTSNGRGYFYLDMPKLMQVVTKLTPPDTIPAPAKNFLDAMLGVGVSYVVPDSVTAQIDLLVSFKAK
jgi:hypothetical protein